MVDRSALRSHSKVVRRTFTDAIKSTNPIDSKVYAKATNWVYEGTLGCTASAKKKSLGLSKSDSLRDNMSSSDLVAVMFSEQMAAEAICSTGLVQRDDVVRIGKITKAAKERCLSNHKQEAS